MIDLTPLDVRKKKGDFRRAMRGYEPAQVDDFLDLAAERLEELVRENGVLGGRVEEMERAMAEYRDRERAMNEALVSAQQLREEMREQASRESELLLKDARGEAEQIVGEARRQAAVALEALRRLQGQRARFLRVFRTLVERQLGELDQEEAGLREVARLDADERSPASAEVG